MLSDAMFKLRRTNPDGIDGILPDELEAYKEEVKALQLRAAKARTAEEYDEIAMELSSKMRLYNETKKDRSENINALLLKLDNLKKRNEMLYQLKDRKDE